jgi:hypothetical protein
MFAMDAENPVDWEDAVEEDSFSRVSVLMVREGHSSGDGQRLTVAATGVSSGSESHVPVGYQRKLGWDSMASINVVQNLDDIPGARRLRTAREAVGVGGAKPITHSGKSEVFGGIDMAYIEGGGVPNLLSMGRSLQADSTGHPGIAIFTDKGAVRFRAPPKLQRVIEQLVSQVDSAGLVEGTAVQRGFVYEEDFGGATPTETDEGAALRESAYGVSVNMYASRVHLDKVDHLLDFMVAAGLSKEALLAAVENDTVRGLPALVTARKVKHYFNHIGKDADQLEAEVVVEPLRTPLGSSSSSESSERPTPGAHLQIDNVTPPFANMRPAKVVRASDGAGAGKRASITAVAPSLGGYKDAVVALDVGSRYMRIEGRVTKKDPHKVVERTIAYWLSQWGNLTMVTADKEFVTKESQLVVNRAGTQGLYQEIIAGTQL